MALNWTKWGRDFLLSLMRHVGTALATWGGLSLQDGVITRAEWHALWIAILSGAVIPTLVTAFQNPPADDATAPPPAPKP